MKEINQYKDLPNTIEEDEAMDALARLGAGIGLKEVFTDMGKALANHELAHQQAQQNLLDSTPPHPFKDAFKVEPVSLDKWMEHAPTPQPTLESVLKTIGEQFALLATVISQQPNTTPPEGDQSLQDCVALTLQQADWFRTMVRHELVGLDVEVIAREALEGMVEEEVESYFDHRFDVTDHFDFNDAVCSEVADQIDDVVRDRVMDSLEEVVAEKLSEASIKVEF